MIALSLQYVTALPLAANHYNHISPLQCLGCIRQQYILLLVDKYTYRGKILREKTCESVGKEHFMEC